jgi:integrase
MPQDKLKKRNIDALEPTSERYTLWDTELIGFGLRVSSAGHKVYVIKYRINGRQRWYTIGRHGSPWTPELARKEAFRLLSEIAHGEDPSQKRAFDRAAITFRELCDLYLAEGVAHKKPSTMKSDIGRVRHHLIPLLGSKRADSITIGDIERLLIDVTKGKTAPSKPTQAERKVGSVVHGGPGVAAQCVTLAGTIFAFAVRRGIRPDNPAHGIKKPPVKKMNRFLSEVEIATLACALDAESVSSGAPYPSAAIKMLLLTGCRKSEILNLRWIDVDFEHKCLRLPDSKTGAKIVYLNAPALAILTELPRVERNPYVFIGTRNGTATKAIDKVWARVRAKAGLTDVRIHDLRHSYASVGAVGGFSLPIIGALLGHKHAMTTARYAHLSADPLRAANEAVGGRIAAAMADSRPELPASIERGHRILQKLNNSVRATSEEKPL